MVAECRGNWCEHCADGVPRYEGKWADASVSEKERYPSWDPSTFVDHCAEEGTPWHCGKMRPYWYAHYVGVRVVRRPLTDKEREVERKRIEARRAQYEADVAEAAKALRRA